MSTEISAEQQLVAAWEEVGAPPLSPLERDTKASLLRALGSFWDSAKFRKGLCRPCVRYGDVAALVDEAAEIVVRVRRVLRRLRDVDVLEGVPAGGAAVEFLHSLVASPLDADPTGAAFVADLVERMCSTDSGLVAGVDAEALRVLVPLARAHLDAARAAAHPADPLEALRAEFARTAALVDRLLAEPAPGPAHPHARRMRTVINDIAGLNGHLERMLLIRERERLADAREMDVEAASEGTSPLAEAMRLEPPVAEAADGENSEAEAKAAAAEEARAAAEAKAAAEKAAAEAAEAAEAARAEAEHDRTVLAQIERVAFNVVVIENDLRVVGESVRSLDEEALMRDPVKGEKDVETLQKRVLRGSETLVNDLVALDALVGSSEVVRPARKAQVLKIQGILAEVDAINQHLRELNKELHERAAELREQQEAEQRAQKQQAEQAEQEAAAAARAAAAAARQAGSPGAASGGDSDSGSAEEDDATQAAEARRRSEITSSDNPWRALKLRPKFDVQEYADRYIVSAHVPGMRTQDLHVGFDGNDPTVLSITGFRGPTADEIAALRGYLAKERPFLRARPQDDDDALLLRLGAGRFGSFAERFRLPDSVDRARVSASYEAGQVQVTLPKRAPPRRALPHVPPPHPRRGAAAAAPRRSSGSPFFSDSDFFW